MLTMVLTSLGLVLFGGLLLLMDSEVGIHWIGVLGFWFVIAGELVWIGFWVSLF